MKVIVDTSVIVDFLRTKSLQSVYVKVKKNSDVIFSLITVAELYSGKSVQEEGLERKTLEKIIHGAEIGIPDLQFAERVGKLRARYKVSLADAFIAVLALDYNVPLATLDKKAFGKIKGLKLY